MKMEKKWIAYWLLLVAAVVSSNAFLYNLFWFVSGLNFGCQWRSYYALVVAQGEKWKREWGLDKPAEGERKDAA